MRIKIAIPKFKGPTGSALDHGGHMHISAPGIHVGQRYFHNEMVSTSSYGTGMDPCDQC